MAKKRKLPNGKARRLKKYRKRLLEDQAVMKTILVFKGERYELK